MMTAADLPPEAGNLGALSQLFNFVFSFYFHLSAIQSTYSIFPPHSGHLSVQQFSFLSLITYSLLHILSIFVSLLEQSEQVHLSLSPTYQVLICFVWPLLQLPSPYAASPCTPVYSAHSSQCPISSQLTSLLTSEGLSQLLPEKMQLFRLPLHPPLLQLCPINLPHNQSLCTSPCCDILIHSPLPILFSFRLQHQHKMYLISHHMFLMLL